MGDVFKKLVHISEFAWMLLMGFVTCMYFLLGVITYATKEENVIGPSLFWISCSLCFVFIPLTLLIYVKMKIVFSSIIRDEKWSLQTASEQNQNINTRSEHSRNTAGRAERERNQLARFWFGRPNLIIFLAQWMQVI